MKRDPIRYISGPGAGYSTTVMLVRLRRDSLGLLEVRDYRAVPQSFVEFVSQQPRHPDMSICPLFLEGRFYLPESVESDFFGRLRAGIAEYIGPRDRFFRFNNCQPACISDGEVATLLTNFRLRYSDPVTAEKAFKQLEKLPEVASVEWWPHRVITVRVPRGQTEFNDAPVAETLHAKQKEAVAAASEVAMLSLSQWAKIPSELTRIQKLLEGIQKCTCKHPKDIPDDSYQRWWAEAIDAPKDANLGDGMTIAILDLGADHTHPELQNRVIPGMANATLTDSVNDGTFASSQLALNPNYPRGSHGTAVASIIAGSTVGVLPKAQVLSFQVAADKPFTSADGQLRYFPVDPVLYLSALNTLSLWAWPVTVANMSIGGQAPLALAEADALASVASKGITLIASAGNSFRPGDFSGVMYPARSPLVLSVGAVGIESHSGYYKLASFSNFDPDDFNVNVVAPGVGIYHAVPEFAKPDGSLYAWGNGTSYASPYATAIAAQTIKLRGAFEPKTQAVRLQDQSKDADFDYRHGYGLAKWPKTE